MTGREPSTPVLFWDTKTYLPYQLPDFDAMEREVVRRVQAHFEAHSIDEAHGDIVDSIIEEWKHSSQADIDVQCSAKLSGLEMIYEQGAEHRARLQGEYDLAVSNAKNANAAYKERYKSVYGIRFRKIKRKKLSTVTKSVRDGLSHRSVHDRIQSWTPSSHRPDGSTAPNPSAESGDAPTTINFNQAFNQRKGERAA